MSAIALEIKPFIKPEILRLNHLHSSGTQFEMLRLEQLHPIVSGNKWLKLSGWLQEAKANGRTGIMTMGGLWSNHLHAAAFYCHGRNIPFTAIVKSAPDSHSPMLQDVLDWGGQIVRTTGALFSDENHWQQVAEKANCQLVPMGGDGEPGTLGVTQFFDQYHDYAYDEIWCATGTATTLEGIIRSAIQSPVVVGFNPGITDKMVDEKMEKLRKIFQERTIKTYQNANSKFGRPLPGQWESMNRFFELSGIATDQVYTGKMIHYLMQQLTSENERMGKRILLVHTGGLQGNRSLAPGLLKFSGTA